MLRTILRLRGLSPEAIADLKSRGARVLDVRTRAEFASGHALGSVNIPLDQLEGRLQELDRGKPLIVVCATGSRSAFAKTLLERAGFPEVANGGPWQRVS
ncbi:MAG: rhodanese-like domain-containing protein [Acidobacteria bacterium]|nr:rhodanese-like domain-containing protein [Acidobacteriota bacterium]